MKKCQSCGEILIKRYGVGKLNWELRKFCNRKCFFNIQSKRLKAIGGINQGGTSWNKGKKMPTVSGEKHYRWKGDKVGYDGLHDWVKLHLGEPDTCVNCKRNGLSGRFIHWANISGKYKRDLNDWKRLCAKCHKRYDLEMHEKKNITSFKRKRFGKMKNYGTKLSKSLRNSTTTHG